MFWIDVVSRVVHIATAIMLLGGSLYNLLLVQPLLDAQSDVERQKLSSNLTAQWKRFVHLGILLFLVTGFYNYVRAMPSHKGDGLYHALIGTKILLALGVFFLASALVGRSEKLQALRSGSGWALKLLCLLGLIIVAISGFVKVSS